MDSRACGQSPKMQRSFDSDLQPEKFYGCQLYSGEFSLVKIINENVNYIRAKITTPVVDALSVKIQTIKRSFQTHVI